MQIRFRHIDLKVRHTAGTYNASVVWPEHAWMELLAPGCCDGGGGGRSAASLLKISANRSGGKSVIDVRSCLRGVSARFTFKRVDSGGMLVKAGCKQKNSGGNSKMKNSLIFNFKIKDGLWSIQSHSIGSHGAHGSRIHARLRFYRPTCGTTVRAAKQHQAGSSSTAHQIIPSCFKGYQVSVLGVYVSCMVATLLAADTLCRNTGALRRYVLSLSVPPYNQLFKY